MVVDAAIGAFIAVERRNLLMFSVPLFFFAESVIQVDVLNQLRAALYSFTRVQWESRHPVNERLVRVLVEENSEEQVVEPAVLA